MNARGRLSESKKVGRPPPSLAGVGCRKNDFRGNQFQSCNRLRNWKGSGLDFDSVNLLLLARG